MPDVFIQDNLSSSRKGKRCAGSTIRSSFTQMGKLVRVIKGSIFDVAVDIRKGSPTFGKWVGRTLTGENRLALWVPAGFAHGFLALEDESLVLYKCTEIHIAGIGARDELADPKIGITWPIEPTLVTAKDAAAPPLADADYNFRFTAR